MHQHFGPNFTCSSSLFYLFQSQAMPQSRKRAFVPSAHGERALSMRALVVFCWLRGPLSAEKYESELGLNLHEISVNSEFI